MKEVTHFKMEVTIFLFQNFLTLLYWEIIIQMEVMELISAVNIEKRYQNSGNFSVRYENLINSERGLPGYGKSTVYNIRWTHSKDPKSSPNSSFSASVNFGSSDYFRQSVNQLNTANFLNNNLSSSINYSKTFPGSAGVRLSLTANMSQNTQTQQVNLTLPTLTLNSNRFYPFERKGKSKKGFLQNINIQYSSKADNRAIFADDLLLKKGMFDNAKSGSNILFLLTLTSKC